MLAGSAPPATGISRFQLAHCPEKVLRPPCIVGWGPSETGTTLLAMIVSKKSAPSRHALRLKSFSPAQPSHRPTFTSNVNGNRSARLTGATAQP